MKKWIVATLIAAMLLFGTTFLLRPVVESIRHQEHLEMMKLLLPGSGSFTVEPYSGEDQNIVSVHKAENGFVIETVTHGYADEIRMLVGVSKEGKVTGLVVMEAHETLGLGSKVLTDHRFLSQFLNKDGSFTVDAAEADGFSSATGTESTTGNEIGVDAIAGATVSSKAVIRCVNSAVAYVTGADAGSSATSWGG